MAHVQLTAHVSFLLKRHFDTISTKPEGYSLVVERIPTTKAKKIRPKVTDVVHVQIKKIIEIVPQ